MPTLRTTLKEFALFVAPFPSGWRAAYPLPAGDGHAVLILPCLGRSDEQTRRLRERLGSAGYRVQGWEQGVNLGPTRRLMDGARRQLSSMAHARGPVSVVGYSMGGLFARWLALRQPEQVRQVITVCSPFRDAPRSLMLSLEPWLDRWPGADLRALAAEVQKPLPVPASFIYSKDDGLVDWRCCYDPSAPTSANIEVKTAHTQIVASPLVTRIVAELLARPAAALLRSSA